MIYENAITIHIPEPTVAKVRCAVQSLAGRNIYPVHEGMFHGLIDETSAKRLLGVPADPFLRKLNVAGTGVVFRVTDAVRGAIVYGEQSDLLQIETRN